MYVQVYFHKVVRILNIHLLELINSYIERGLFSKEEFHQLTDAHFIALALKERENPLVRRLFLREHFREVYKGEDPKEFEQVKSHLLERFDEKDLRFDIAEKNLIEEEFYINEEGRLIELRDASQILKTLPKVQIYRIYIEPRLKEYALQHLKKTA